MTKETNQKQILYAVLAIIAISVLFLMIFTACGGSPSSADSSKHSVLVVSIDYEAAESKISDTVQVENALTGGGMIILNPDKLDQTFKDTVAGYGAFDAEGSYYTFGALLNYIASRGWELIQAPSSGLSDTYYFAK